MLPRVDSLVVLDISLELARLFQWVPCLVCNWDFFLAMEVVYLVYFFFLKFLELFVENGYNFLSVLS